MKKEVFRLVTFTKDLQIVDRVGYEENGKTITEIEPKEVEFPYHTLVYDAVDFHPIVGTIHETENGTRYRITKDLEPGETVKNGKLIKVKK